MLTCEKCGININNKGSMVRHINTCNLDEETSKNIIKDYVVNLMSIKKIREKYNIGSYNKVKFIFNKNEVKFRSKYESSKISHEKYKYKHTDDTKSKMSSIKKNFFKN